MFIVKFIKNAFRSGDQNNLIITSSSNNNYTVTTKNADEMNSADSSVCDSDNDDLEVVIDRKRTEYVLSQKLRKKQKEDEKQAKINDLNLDQIFIDYFTKNRKQIRETIIKTLKKNEYYSYSIKIWSDLQNEKWFKQLYAIQDSSYYYFETRNTMKNVIVRNQSTLKEIIKTTSTLFDFDIDYDGENKHYIVYTDHKNKYQGRP